MKKRRSEREMKAIQRSKRRRKLKMPEEV